MASVAILAIVYVQSQFFRSCLAVLSPELTRDLGVKASTLSAAAGIWFVAFALMQFLVGWSLDRFGPRRTVCAGLLVMISGALTFAAAQDGLTIVVAMALIGVGCSPQLVSAIFIFGRVFPPRRFAVLTAWFVAVGLFGGVLGSAPLALAVSAYGWRSVLVALAVFAGCLTLLVYFAVKDPSRIGDESGRDNGSLVDLLRLRSLWPLIPMSFVAYAPAANIRGLWAGPYLSEVHSMSLPAVGTVTFAMAMALIAGSLSFGPLDVIFRTRKWIPFTGASLTALCLVALALFGSGSSTLATVLLAATVFFCANYSIILAHARAFMPAHLLGRGITLMNFFSIGGAGVIQFVSGGVFALAGGTAASPGSFTVIFLFYAALLAIGLSIYSLSTDRPPDPNLAKQPRPAEPAEAP